MRRLISLILMGLAFYGGLQMERFLSEGRCQNAGGVMQDGICTGVVG